MHHHHQPSETSARPGGRPTTRRRRRRRTLAALIVLLVLAALAAMAPTVAARPGSGSAAGAAFLPPTTDPPEPPEPTDPPEPPEPPVTKPPPPTVPNPECDDTAGFARPSGVIPPGYVYSPTKFDGTIRDPQPDDTFAADAAGHGVHTGRLRSRMVAGQEQVLVCAHVGTNTPADALTPFPTTGTGAHPATIAPRVVLIGANGARTTYVYGAAGTQSSLSHYAGSTDVHQGYAQMWVPLPASLKEPGFVVRVEVRGTSALTSGGIDQVMGADEVYVHLGPSPTYKGTRVDDAVGVSVTAGAVAERPTDPGPDDLSALLEPTLKPLIAKRIRAMAPQDIDLGVHGELWSLANITFGSARLDSLSNTVNRATLDVVNYNYDAPEGRGEITLDARLFPRITVEPNSIGVVSITGGSCAAAATVDVSVRVGFVVDLAPDGSKPVLDITFVDTSGTVQDVDVSGRLDLYWLAQMSCSHIEGDIHDGVVDGMKERLQGLEGDLELRAGVEAQVADMLAPADLRNGPLASVDAKLPSGVGFGLAGSRYTPTAPAGHTGGDVFITEDGVNLAAGTQVTDLGGSRFPYSQVPSSTRGVVPSLGGSYRPGSAQTYDVGLVVNGRSVNQLLRALSAGNAENVGLLDLKRKVGALDIGIKPSSAPMYLPTAPAGWPAKAEAPVRLYVPSLRIAIPVPTVATMVADVRAGVDATIDETNHLVPLARASKVDVEVRFLHLGSTVNQMKDPSLDPEGIPATATTAILEKVPPALGAVLTPIRIPDLAVDGGPPIHLDHLTVGTVSGGHLGAWVDVEPGNAAPAPPAIFAALAPAGTAPTALIMQALPGAMPLPGEAGPVRVSWTVRDVGLAATAPPVYQSPEDGEPVGQLVKGVVVSGLTVRTTDPCTGELEAGVMVTVTAVKDGVTRTSTVPVGHAWAGPAPTHVPSVCYPDDPPEEPEPTIPPMCQAKPWLCDDF